MSKTCAATTRLWSVTSWFSRFSQHNNYRCELILPVPFSWRICVAAKTRIGDGLFQRGRFSP